MGQASEGAHVGSCHQALTERIRVSQLHPLPAPPPQCCCLPGPFGQVALQLVEDTQASLYSEQPARCGYCGTCRPQSWVEGQPHYRFHPQRQYRHHLLHARPHMELRDDRSRLPVERPQSMPSAEEPSPIPCRSRSAQGRQPHHLAEACHHRDHLLAARMENPGVQEVGAWERTEGAACRTHATLLVG